MVSGCHLGLLSLIEYTRFRQALIWGLCCIIDFVDFRAVPCLGYELHGWLEEINV
ncbi:MAG: hypothetical protein Q8P44_06285 [Dehalococcoidia bacterium]|nr:hypothetical protein [Dehalococcoidia bacterium]